MHLSLCIHDLEEVYEFQLYYAIVYTCILISMFQSCYVGGNDPIYGKWKKTCDFIE